MSVIRFDKGAATWFPRQGTAPFSPARIGGQSVTRYSTSWVRWNRRKLSSEIMVRRVPAPSCQTAMPSRLSNSPVWVSINVSPPLPSRPKPADPAAKADADEIPLQEVEGAVRRNIRADRQVWAKPGDVEGNVPAAVQKAIDRKRHILTARPLGDGIERPVRADGQRLKPGIQLQRGEIRGARQFAALIAAGGKGHQAVVALERDIERAVAGPGQAFAVSLVAAERAAIGVHQGHRSARLDRGRWCHRREPACRSPDSRDLWCWRRWRRRQRSRARKSRRNSGPSPCQVIAAQISRLRRLRSQRQAGAQRADAEGLQAHLVNWRSGRRHIGRAIQPSSAGRAAAAGWGRAAADAGSCPPRPPHPRSHRRAAAGPAARSRRCWPGS